MRDELRRRQALRAWRTVEWDHRARAPKGWTSFHTFVQALQEDPKDRAAGWLLARVAFDRLQEQSVRAVGTEVQEQIRVYPRERQSAFLSHTIRSLIACRTQATVRLAIWLRCASALQSAPRVVEALLNGLWEAHLLPGGPGASETVRRRATSVPNCAGNADVEALCLRAIARYVATGGSRGTAFLTRIKGLESAARTLPSWLEELPLQDPTARAWMEAVIETFTEDASLPKPEVISWFLFHLEPAGSVVPGRVWGTPHWARAALSLEDDGAVAIYLARVAVPWEWLLSAAKSGFLDGKSDARWQQVARALPEPRTGAAWLDPLDDAAGRARLVRLLLCSTTNYGDGISRKAAAARILAENRTARIPLDERYCPDSQVLAALRDLALPGPGARRLSNEEHALAGELTWVVSMRPSIREADLEVLPSLARRADPDAIAHWMAAAMPRAPRVVDLLALGVLRAAVDERVRTNAPTEDESAYVAWLARILTGRWSAFSQARRERPQEMADLLDRWFDPYMPRPTALLLWELREPPTPRPRSSIPRSRMVFLKSPAHVPGGSQ
ncbi:hypothetical protein [Longimicrobium sp.]|uniref:hypothetical protein n=1 Tax=Longimicrobium sp. TaxID=2029185 RepID=UPI002E30459E|nr:hypothetical protein [Longimicrobium sp.]HEX6040706.1 hypothetical protein [Longimicrobium sp.]